MLIVIGMIQLTESTKGQSRTLPSRVKYFPLNRNRIGVHLQKVQYIVDYIYTKTRFYNSLSQLLLKFTL